MNSNISTYKDLLAEKLRLSLVLEERKILVEAEFEEIKVKLKSLTNVIEVIEKATSKDTHNPILNAGINMGVNFLLKNLLLRNAGWVVKMIVPMLVKNYLSHEATEAKNIFQRSAVFQKAI